MRPRPTALLLLIGGLALGPGGCGERPPPVALEEGPVACEASPCALFEHLDRFELEGLAAAVATASPGEPREDWREGFDAAPAGRLLGDGGSIEGDGADRHVSLRTRSGPPVWVSDPIPLDGDRDYTLRWREAYDALDSPGRTPREFAGLSVRFYRLPGKDPASALADPAREKAARVQAHRSAEWRPVAGGAPWHEEERSFRRPRDATHLQIRIAGGAPAPGRRSSVVRLDDVVLSSRLAPAWTARKNDVWAEPGRHPLLRKARGNHPVHNKARDVREVVLAPAPSALRARIAVPEGGRLSLGFGLTPGEGTAKVTFEAAVVEGIERTVLLHDTAAGTYRPPWQDAELDLGPWAGRTVTLELRTEGDPAPEGALQGLARQPEGRAVWTTGQLEGAGRGRLAVLVLVDTLGARHASGWGGPRRTTPNLERIAARGAWYGRALAPSPWTLPSIASYLTGLSPDEHGAGQKLGSDHWDRRPVLPAIDTLAERLRDAGWHTQGWVNNPFLAPRNSALDQGFSSYVDYGTRSSVHAAEPAVQRVLEDLARPGDGDRFVLLHLLDPHGPYAPDEEHLARFADPAYRGPVRPGLGREKGGFRDVLNRRVQPSAGDKQRLRDLHEALIAYADEQVGAVFDAAEATGRDLLFVVTSDHGEELWEHGRFEHGHSVYDELLHVPLLSWRSGAAPSRIEATVDARGVFGAVLDFAGLEHPGTPSLPAAPSGPVFASPTLYGHRQRAVEADGWTYALLQPETGEPHRRVAPTPRQALYERATDPDERRNRLADEPERAAALHDRLVQEALTGFPGAWFVIASGEPTMATLVEQGADGWHPDVHDFPWPRPDGAQLEEGALRVERSVRGETSRIALTVGHGPTLLLLEPRAPGGRVHLELPPGVDAVTRGSTRAGDALDFGEEPARWTAAEVLEVLRSGDVPRLVVGRLPGEPRPRGRDAAPDGDDVDALRALGYME